LAADAAKEVRITMAVQSPSLNLFPWLFVVAKNIYCLICYWLPKISIALAVTGYQEYILPWLLLDAKKTI